RVREYADGGRRPARPRVGRPDDGFHAPTELREERLYPVSDRRGGRLALAAADDRWLGWIRAEPVGRFRLQAAIERIGYRSSGGALRGVRRRLYASARHARQLSLSVG